MCSNPNLGGISLDHPSTSLERVGPISTKKFFSNQPLT